MYKLTTAQLCIHRRIRFQVERILTLARLVPAVCICAGILVAHACGNHSAGAEWKTFEDSDGNFKVALPGDAKKVSTDDEKGLTYHGPVQSFSVLWYVVDASDVQTRDAAVKYLDAGQGSAVAREKGRLRSEKSLNWNGYPGRYFEITKELPECLVVAALCSYRTCTCWSAGQCTSLRRVP